MQWQPFYNVLAAIIIGAIIGNVQAIAQPFRIVDAQYSGIHYKSNTNRVDVPFEGHGVGVADFDNDGLNDIFFAGDVAPALYKNKGKLQFENVWKTSGIKAEKGMHTVSITDFNYDGKPDIIVGFVARLHQNDTLHIKIYLNEGNFTFREANRSRYNINSQLPSISRINVFDVNKDGYWDMLINHWNGEDNQFIGILPNIKSPLQNDVVYDQLWMYENGEYKDKTKEYKLFSEVPVRVCFNSIATDINNDSYPDLIFSNDFDEPSQVLINKEGKYFENTKNKLFKVTSFYGMGSDAADINNDGLIDYFECDMRPANNYGSKTIRYETPYTWYELSRDKNNILENQFVRNTLQLNNGCFQPFTEIGQLAGIDATEWSWSPLIADFDNDGWKDIFISNGVWHPQAFEFDFVQNFMESQEKNNAANIKQYLQNDTLVAPYFKNYLFKNNADLTFSNMQSKWGFDKAIDSRGSAYADFDNDGDLDIAVNNSNSKSFIYENENKLYPYHYLRIQLQSKNNIPLWHSKIELYCKGKKQVVEYNPIRGFYSSSESIIHFGLGDNTVIDSLVIKWNNKTQTNVYYIPADTLIKITLEEANNTYENICTTNRSHLFNKINPIFWKDTTINRNEFVENPLIRESKENSRFLIEQTNNSFQVKNQDKNIAEWKPKSYYETPEIPEKNIQYNQKMNGFWNCTTAADIDNDGDIDYLLGNLGLNTRWKATAKEPLKLYLADFDNNGSEDMVSTHFENGKEYPDKPLDVYKSRISGLAKKFYKYHLFGNATIDKMFDKTVLDKAKVFDCYETRSGVLINNGNGIFTFKPFNNEIQIAPIYSMMAEDFNRDGFIDILAVGNKHGVEVERGKYTGCNGWYLLGNGKGDFVKANDKSFSVNGEGRTIQVIANPNSLWIVVFQLQDSLLTYEYKIAAEDEVFLLPQHIKKAVLKLKTGGYRRYDFTHSLTSTRFILKRKDEVVLFEE